MSRRIGPWHVGALGLGLKTDCCGGRRMVRAAALWSIAATAALILGALLPATLPLKRDAAPQTHACSADPGGAGEHAACITGPGWSACFAPGTTREHMLQIDARMRARAHALPNAFETNGRWTTTASGGGSAPGTPAVLTYSFPPDVNTGHPESDNVINARFDQIFNNDRQRWRTMFRDIFAEWSNVTGVTYIEVEDDGAPWPDTAGQIGARGDVRIVMFAVDGPDNLLAFNYFPSSGGDMAMDSDENWGDPNQSYRFVRNVVMHESGHGIGLSHVLPLDETKLMEPIYTSNFFGPQDDDIRGANSMYGDPLEPNNSAAAARDLGPFVEGATFGMLSLHSGSDADWFKVSVSAGGFVAAEVRPLGSAYTVGPQFGGPPVAIDTTSISALRIEVLGQNGTTPLASADAGSVGATVVSPLVLVPAGNSFVFLKVSTVSGAGVQRYSLKLTTSGAAARRVNVTSEPAGVLISTSLTDTAGKTSLTTPGFFGYAVNQTMTLSAPLISGNALFARWSVNGVDQPPDIRDVALTTTGNFDVKAIYVVALTANAGPDVNIFPGENTQLRPTVTGGTAPIQFRWTPVSGFLNPSSATILSPIVKPATNTTYTLTVTDAIGLTTSDSVIVNVLPPLTANAGADQFVAPGQTFRLTASAAGGTPPYTFNWGPAAILQQTSGPIVDGSVQDTSLVTLTVTDATGRSITDTVIITVVRPLTVELGEDQGAVAGAFVNLNPVITGGRPPYTVVWTPEPTQRDGNRAVIFPDKNAKYNIIVTDSEGQQATDSITVFLIETLAGAAGASATTIAPGGSVTLAANPSGGLGPYTFQWSPATGLDSATSANPTATVSATTTYTVTIRDAGGRTTTSSVQIVVEDEAARVTPSGGCGGASLTMIGGLWAISRVVGRKRKANHA